MNTNRPKKIDEENVQALAHDLLGVDLSATDDNDEPLDVDGLGLDDLGFGEPQSEDRPTSAPVIDTASQTQVADDDPIAWIVSASKAPARRPADLDDEDAGFGGGLIEDDFGDGIGETVKQDHSNDSDEQRKVAKVELDDTAESRSDRDAYWDALDEDDPKPRKKRTGRSRSKGEPEVEPAPAARTTQKEPEQEQIEEKPKRKRRPKKRQRPEPVQSELVEDDGFGAGLLDDVSSNVVDEDVEESFEDDVVEAPSSKESYADDESFGGDDFGAGLLDSLDDADDSPKPKRRRPPRRKKVQREEKTAAKSDNREVAQRDSESRSSSAPEKAPATKKNKDRYANIPTWEQAIGFLDLKRQKSSGNRSSSGGGRGRSGGQSRGRGRKSSKD